ncbi:MAG: transglutaminase-like domain-containing protein [Burkholderiales bacterium]
MYLGQRRPALLGTLFAIPDGVEGVKATLYLMRRLVRQYKIDPNIRHVAASLVQHLPQKDWAGQVERLHAFVRDDIRYLRDIDGIETVQTPDKTLELAYGDCDDKVTLLATLLQSIGHPVRFIAIGTKTPGEFSHVFLDTLIGRKWVSLETTEPVPMGWEPPREKQIARMIVKV